MWEVGNLSEYDNAGYMLDDLPHLSLTLLLMHKHTPTGCRLLGTHCFEVSTLVSPPMHLKELDRQQGVSSM